VSRYDALEREAAALYAPRNLLSSEKWLWNWQGARANPRCVTTAAGAGTGKNAKPEKLRSPACEY